MQLYGLKGWRTCVQVIFQEWPLDHSACACINKQSASISWVAFVQDHFVSSNTNFFNEGSDARRHKVAGDASERSDAKFMFWCQQLKLGRSPHNSETQLRLGRNSLQNEHFLLNMVPISDPANLLPPESPVAHHYFFFFPRKKRIKSYTHNLQLLC